MHPTTLRCAVCKIEVAIEDIKYHTPRDEQPTRIFCGAEHTHSYFMEKRKEMRKQITILKILTTLTAIALLIQVVELFV